MDTRFNKLEEIYSIKAPWSWLSTNLFLSCICYFFFLDSFLAKLENYIKNKNENSQIVILGKNYFNSFDCCAIRAVRSSFIVFFDSIDKNSHSFYSSSAL